MATWTQDGKPMRVQTTLGKDVLLLDAVSGESGVSSLFHYTLTVLSQKSSIDPKDILGTKASIGVELPDGSYRNVYGMIRRFSQLGSQQGLLSCSAELVPSAWVLTRSTDWRIFQNMTTQDIVEKVLQGAGITDFRFSLSGTYDPRPYCTQFGETHLDFIARLIEEEGIYYFFDHTGTSDVMVFADGPTAVKPVPGLATLDFTATPGSMDNVVTSFTREDSVCTAKVTTRDFDFTKAGPSDAGALTSAIAGTASGQQEIGESYDYPGGFEQISAGDRRARVRLEELEALAEVVRGESNCRALESGWSADVSGTLSGGAKGPFHLLRVTMSASLQGTYFATSSGAPFTFAATFTAIPQTVPYRSPRSMQKPVVRGTQTAIVTGPSGEEIYVDKYGRVKVQFHWDRLGKFDDNSSCWIRVATPWAGKAWGMVHPPRIGQEVVVDFLDGDPDRPLITGLVYNAEQMPPYTLPDNKTQSGVKSRSSMSGTADNFNEVRFEDKMSSELIAVQAEKDLTVLVKHDETRTVQHDRTTTITNDETQTVSQGNEVINVDKGNQTITIGQGNQTLTIKQGDQTIEITQGKQGVSIMGNRSVAIKQGNDQLDISTGNLATTVSMGNVTTKVSLGEITMTAMQGIELTVGQNSIKIDQTGITIQGMMISITGQVQTQIKGLMTQVNADAMLQLKGGITMIN